jgi:hypothetical protein
MWTPDDLCAACGALLTRRARSNLRRRDDDASRAREFRRSAVWRLQHGRKREARPPPAEPGPSR